MAEPLTPANLDWRLERVLCTNAVARAVLTAWERAGHPRQAMMGAAVVALAEQNQALLERLVELQLRAVAGPAVLTAPCHVVVQENGT